MDSRRKLQRAAAAFFTRISLHGQLARVEWAEEKTRLLRMLLVTLLGFASLLCVLLFAGALTVALTWNTEHRLQALIALTALYGLGTLVALRRFLALASQGDQSFAAIREELLADAEMLKTSYEKS